jgi:hypothetical protein
MIKTIVIWGEQGFSAYPMDYLLAGDMLAFDYAMMALSVTLSIICAILCALICFFAMCCCCCCGRVFNSTMKLVLRGILLSVIGLLILRFPHSSIGAVIGFVVSGRSQSSSEVPR